MSYEILLTWNGCLFMARLSGVSEHLLRLAANAVVALTEPLTGTHHSRLVIDDFEEARRKFYEDRKQPYHALLYWPIDDKYAAYLIRWTEFLPHSKKLDAFKSVIPNCLELKYRMKWKKLEAIHTLMDLPLDLVPTLRHLEETDRLHTFIEVADEMAEKGRWSEVFHAVKPLLDE